MLGDSQECRGALAIEVLQQFVDVQDERLLVRHGGAVAVGGDAELRQTGFDAAKRGHRLVQLRTLRVVGEPGVVRHRQDGLRAQPGAVDGELGVHVVQADEGRNGNFPAVSQA